MARYSIGTVLLPYWILSWFGISQHRDPEKNVDARSIFGKWSQEATSGEWGGWDRWRKTCQWKVSCWGHYTLWAVGGQIPPSPTGRMWVSPSNCPPQDQGCWGIYHPVPAALGLRVLPRTDAQSITEGPVCCGPRSARTCLHGVPPETDWDAKVIWWRSSSQDEEEATVSLILHIRDWIRPELPSWKVAKPE